MARLLFIIPKKIGEVGGPHRRAALAAPGELPSSSHRPTCQGIRGVEGDPRSPGGTHASQLHRSGPKTSKLLG